jgi:hypothetical protein
MKNHSQFPIVFALGYHGKNPSGVRYRRRQAVILNLFGKPNQTEDELIILSEEEDELLIN